MRHGRTRCVALVLVDLVGPWRFAGHGCGLSFRGPDNTGKDGACPSNAVRERVYGASEELRPFTLPRGYG